MKKEVEKVAELPEPSDNVAAAVVGDYLYITDGQGLYRFYSPPKTVWEMIRDWLRKNPRPQNWELVTYIDEKSARDYTPTPPSKD